MKKLNVFFFFLFSCWLHTEAQELQRLDFDVFKDGLQLRNPFSGGLKAPQFSEVDLNGDGVKDLFVFDRAGNVKLTFINKGTSNKVDYDYAPYYSRSFPDLADWAILRDYNGDGIMDIFSQVNTPGIAGIVVYTGRFNNNRLEFDRFNFPQNIYNIIPIPTGGGMFTQLYVSGTDIPAVDDIDGDGDLDILTFSVTGGVLFYYSNQSVEMGYGKDSLLFRQLDNCWGRFLETGITNCLILSDDAEKCADEFTSSGQFHPGSTILTFDADNDGDKEMVLGDISFPSLVFGLNNGDKDRAWFSEQDCSFPSYDEPLSIVNFPSAFYLDVDNDGLKDLVSASNMENVGVSFKSIFWYKNITSNEFPQFNLESQDFMISDMMQFGLGANPVFVDYNADGLMDILVGNLRLNSNDESNLVLFQNIGIATEPAFDLVDPDYLGFKELFATSSLNFNFTPTFGDLDNDGDLDFLTGNDSGTLFYAENTAGAGNPMQFGPLQGDYMGIDVGKKSTPQIIDMDRDGLPDLVIGERTINQDIDHPEIVGNIHFYKNIGTASNPHFDPDPEAAGNTQYFGRVNTLVTGPLSSNAGDAAPVIYDYGTDFLLFSGSSSGQLMVYDQLEGNLYGTFREVDRDYGDLNIGIETRIDVADINDDGFLDLIVGNKRGGLNLYATKYLLDGTVGTRETLADLDFRLWPNPAHTAIQLQWSNDFNNTRGQLQVYDALGRRMVSQRVLGNQLSLEVTGWPEGIYFAELRWGTQRIVRKFVVSR